ncbi:MAG: AAA family ATPase [Promethearchaeota archaeon]
MNKGNFVVCLAGLPASGKSTFAIKLKKALDAKFNPLVVMIIDPDIIRQAISPGNFDYRLESKVREYYLTETRKELQKGTIVISDNLNYYVSMRHDLKELAKDFQVNFFIIHISTPFNVCVQWNRKRGKTIPNKVIRKVYKKFDSFDKYSWDHPLREFDLSQIQNLDEEIENLANIIIQKIESSSLKKEKAQVSEETFNTDNENLDRITRELVGTLLRSSEFLFLRKSILKARKQFIRLNRNSSLSNDEITQNFREFLEKSLEINIPQNLLGKYYKN